MLRAASRSSSTPPPNIHTTCAHLSCPNPSPLILIHSPLPGLEESSHLDPTNPYSAAKAGAELIARAYITSYKMPIIITRGNNVYGPHQFPEKMIPKFTLLASRGRDLPIHGDGSSVRRCAPGTPTLRCNRAGGNGWWHWYLRTLAA